MNASSKPIQVDSALLGLGIYTAGDAARLIKVPQARIRRWLIGYRHTGGMSKPLWSPSIPQYGKHLEVSFLDLMEMRFVQTFISQGVSLQRIRLALERARALFNVEHPFSTKKFRTDGRQIFLEIQRDTGDAALIDLVKNQYAFKAVVAQSFRGLVFDADQVIRWHPWPDRTSIVVDPARAFGTPLVSDEMVPTNVVMSAFNVSKSIKTVAADFIIPERAVRDAIAFEEHLAA